jgi:hypothetical protein
MRKFAWILAATLGLGLAACGGGGDSGSSSTSATGKGTGGTGITQPVTGTMLAADATAVPTDSSATNTVPVTVSATGIVNQPMVSVTICQPNTGATLNCTTVPNVLVDTESFGLRVYASALPATVGSLTQQTIGGKTLAECAIFGTGHTWGSVRNADVKMSGEIATDVPINILADSTGPQPTDCQQNTYVDTAANMKANGILGIGTMAQDCGLDCQNGIVSKAYYVSDGTTSTSTMVPVTQQVTNPVSKFLVDNNGVILEMRQVSDTGSATASGTLVFGIDTKSNNALAGTGAMLLATTESGDFTATYNGVTLNQSFFDSGSNALYFPDSSFARTSNGFYLPTTTVGRSATISSTNLASATVGFNIANALTLASNGAYAMNNLGGYLAGMFDFGIPFFYGRHVYYGIGGTSSIGGGAGPYVAYTSS